MILEALKAAALLERRGVSAKVVNMHTIKPIDAGALDKLTAYRAIATVEEHGAIGGLGSAVAEFFAGHEKRPRQLIISAGDTYYPADTRINTLARAGLDAEGIAARTMAFLETVGE